VTYSVLGDRIGSSVTVMQNIKHLKTIIGCW
jgi:hypothetical protein